METIKIKEVELVRRAKDGDSDALSQLVYLHSERIYNLSLRMMGNEQDAEDVLQETFLTMIKKIYQFEGKSSFYTWLYRVATNISLRKLKEKSLKLPHYPISDPDFERIYSDKLNEWPDFNFSKVSRSRFKNKLNDAINQLPDIYRAVFILRDLQNFSTEDTSNILDITPSNTKIRLMRARNFLKEKLDKIVREEGLI